MKFLQALREAHEEDENAFPFTYCVQLFEEMIAVWCEEVRERRRLLCAKLGTENPRSRGPQTLGTGTWSRQAPEFPVPTNLGPDGPFGAIKAMARLLNKQLHEHVAKKRSAAPEDPFKSGRAPRLALRPEEAPHPH